MSTPEPATVAFSLVDVLPAVLLSAAIVKRLCWDQGEYVMMFEGRLRIYLPDRRFHDWIITETDVTGDDWIVINQDEEE